MTRIGPRRGAAHVAHVRPQRARPHAIGHRSGTESAVLYRGRTVFSYGSPLALAKAGAVRAHRLAAALARKRAMQRRRAYHGGVDDEDEDGSEMGSVHDNLSPVIDRGASSGGGSGTGGGEHQSDEGSRREYGNGNAPERLAVKVRAGVAGSALEPGPLQTLAMSNTVDAAHPTLQELFCEELFKLRDEADREPRTPVTRRVLRLLIDWLDAHQHQPPVPDSMTTRERLIAASRRHGVPQSPVLGQKEGPSRTQRLNLLAYPIALNCNRPWRKHNCARNVLTLIWAASSTRGRESFP